MGRQISSKTASSHGIRFGACVRFPLRKEVKPPEGQIPTGLPGAVSSLGRQCQSKSRSETSIMIGGGERIFPFKTNLYPKGLKPEHETMGDTGLGPASHCFTSFGKQPSSKRSSPNFTVMGTEDRQKSFKQQYTKKCGFANDISSSW